MKIGIVTEYYFPTIGGIQEHVRHFAASARAAGHQVRILTPSVHDSLASRDARDAADRDRIARLDRDDEVIRVGRSLPIFAGGSIARLSVGSGLGRRLREVLAAERFDVLHLHSPLMPTLPLLTIPLADCALAGTFHSVVGGSVLLKVLRPVLQRYLDRLDAAIGVSTEALRGLDDRYRAPWQVIPNGVDVRAFAAGKKRPELDDGRPTILHVGRFDPRNGVDRVIRTFIELRARGRDAKLVLVGDGPLRPRYERMVPDALRRDVRFEGFVASEARASYYASADLLLCPAVGGTFGIILVEAMAAGCPVVAADTPGFRTVMPGGVEGALVDLAEPRVPERLADACERLLLDGTARRRAAAAGRRTAARFDWPVVAERVLAVYQRITGASGDRSSARRERAQQTAA